LALNRLLCFYVVVFIVCLYDCFVYYVTL
jgi:hypothetical protein